VGVGPDDPGRRDVEPAGDAGALAEQAVDGWARVFAFFGRTLAG